MSAAQSPELPAPRELLGDVLWRRLDETWLEHCQLTELDDAYVIRGCVLGALEGRPYRADYLVVCDPEWITREAYVHTLLGSETGELRLQRDDSGSWRANGELLTEMSGLIDIDLSITPSTNTLPIRRLALDVGASALTEAVWIRFPKLAVERLPQRYTRIAERRYRYESRGGSFTAELDVDDQGIVVRYGDVWDRVAG